MANLARHKEAPALLLPTVLRQRLEVEQLANRTPPAREEDLVHRVAELKGEVLKGHLVARDGGEVLPDPAERLLARVDTAKGVRLDVGERLELGGGFGGVGEDET